jgi:uncharacterized protein YkwD
MRNLKFLLAATLLFLFASSAIAQSEPLERNSTERELFDSLNRERAAQGLPELQWDNALFKAARHHALLMLNLNMVEHQLPSEPNLEARLTAAGARFSVIAENIAVGSNARTIHAGWMDSPGHRRNILDPRLNSVGIAAVRGSGGLFAVQDFSQSVASLSVAQQEQKVASLLTAAGWRVSGATEDARKTCGMKDGIAGTRARAMVRFETTDLNKLPEEIEQKLRKRPFGNVAVGACGASGGPGFARFRIAVLFF